MKNNPTKNRLTLVAKALYKRKPHMPKGAQDIYLTQKQLEHRLSVTPMTIYYWRYPQSRDLKDNSITSSLPVMLMPRGTKRHTVLFPLKQVEAWLKEFRPQYAGKIKEDNCGCNHCAGIRNRETIPMRPTRQDPISQPA